MSIEKYKFKNDVCAFVFGEGYIKLSSLVYWGDNVELDKRDVAALAKHFKLTAEDINCPMLKAKQDELNEAGERPVKKETINRKTGL